MTAAVALFMRLGLPEPWTGAAHPSTKPKGGLLIYGAASAVGAFAVQLAHHADIHPILCVAGNGIPYVESLIDKSKGDAVVDYRKGNDHIVSELKAAIPKGEKLQYAVDCVSVGAQGTFANIVAVLDQTAGNSHLTTVLPADPSKEGIPSSINLSRTGVGCVHQAEGREFGTAWFRLFSQGLQDGWFQAHPHEVIPGGLGGVQTGLQNLQTGKASATKYVYRIAETEGLSKL